MSKEASIKAVLTELLLPTGFCKSTSYTALPIECLTASYAGEGGGGREGLSDNRCSTTHVLLVMSLHI